MNNFNDGIDKLQNNYKSRVKSFSSEGRQCNSSYLRGKIVKNLAVSNLIYKNIFDLFSSYEKISNKIIETEEKNSIVINRSQLQNVIKKHKLISPEDIEYHLSTLKKSRCITDSNIELFHCITICFQESINSGASIFIDKSNESKKSLAVFFKYLASLNPFIAGIDAIYNVIRRNHIQYQNADKLLNDLDIYWNNCFSHAVSSKYIEKILLNFVKHHEFIKADITKCVDETSCKLEQIYESYKI
ncbi:MAG: hypothetical protein Q3M30_11115 [Candidatus Electrothrix sp. Rat3]|nr:hypothetical protein [Candidatus Electrothrix rattekaaiensis]